VDFTWLSYAAAVGLAIQPARGRTGVRWVRLVTDTPTALREVLRGRLGMRQYLRSLRGIDVEAAFSRDDPLPALAELLILPYLALTRGY
jgi:predicted ATP-grasp superfamily ATP-dependent carboligase